MNFSAFGLGLLNTVFFSMVGIFGLGFIIFFHELGHFLFAKMFRIRTPSFSIGFGPKIISKKIGETEFVISAIPIGGFVELAGAAEIGQGEQKEAQRRDEHSFATKPFYQKFLVMVGGIAFNILFAYFVMIMLSMIGIPKSPFLYPHNATNVIAQIAPNSAATKAGLKENDAIQAVNGNEVHNALEILEYLQLRNGQIVDLTIMRNGNQITTPVSVGNQDIPGNSVSALGVVFNYTALEGRSFLDAIKQGIQITNKQIANVFNALRYMFRKRDVSQMAGPIMIIAGTMKGAAQGLGFLLLILAIISINLAVLNILPLPILDGGQILFYSIEAIIRRSLPIKVREYIFIASWLLVLSLMLYMSYQDIGRIASPYIEKLWHFLGWNK